MLCVLGGKGGCGKTTVALGLGRALARAGRAPLVVGADTAVPDLRHRLGLDPEPSLDAVGRGADAGRVARQPRTDGPFVLPAGRGDAGDHLHGLRWDGPVVVDCPPGCGPAVASPVRACDRSLVVTTGEPACLADAVKTAAVARRLGAPPAGAVLRERGPRRPARVAGHDPVWLPEVEEPREADLRAAFGRLRRAVWPSGDDSRRPAGRKLCRGRNV